MISGVKNLSTDSSKIIEKQEKKEDSEEDWESAADNIEIKVKVVKSKNSPTVKQPVSSLVDGN